MAGSLGEAVLDLSADDSKLNADVDKAGNAALQKMDQFGQKMKGIGTSMTAAITLPIVAGAAFAVDAASDLVESGNAVNVVFGESAEIMHEFGKSAAENVGLAESEFNQLGAVTGSFLKNLGFDQEAAAQETLKLTARASDMASIFNTDVATALQAMQSGLKGEFNPLETFGVKMNAATIAAKAMEMGLADVTIDVADLQAKQVKAEKAQTEYNKAVAKWGAESDQAITAFDKYVKAQAAAEEATAGVTGELSDNAKAQAALALIYEQTNALAGDFKNTSDGLANSTRILKAQVTDAAAKLGQQLLPYGLKVVQFLSQLIAKFQGLTPEQQKMILLIGGAVAALGPLLLIIGSLISTISALIPVIGAVAGVLTFPLIAVIALIGAAIYLLYQAWKNNWGGMQDKVAQFWAWLQPILQGLLAWFQVNIPRALQTLAGFWTNTLLPAIQTVWSWMQTTLFPLLRQLADLFANTIGRQILYLVDIWLNIFWPLIKRFGDFLISDLWPILKTVGSFLFEYWVQGLRNISQGIQILTNWLEYLNDLLANVHLPDWMTPGSPTPWEMGLWGINDALQAVGKMSLPNLSASMNMMPAPALALSGSGTGDNVSNKAITININANLQNRQDIDYLAQEVERRLTKA